MKRIHVLLPKDRSKPGRLHLYGPDGEHLMAAMVLGQADRARAGAEGNPDCLPTLPYGPTPTGTFKITRVHAVPPEKHAKLGPKWIPLEGATGDAGEANKCRTGLGIHAGRADDPRTLKGQLVPTHGCLRILPRNADLLWANCGSDALLVTVEELE